MVLFYPQADDPSSLAPAQSAGARTGGFGGLGGIGGFTQAPQFGNVLQALGHSLLTSKRGNPMGGFSTALNSLNQQTLRQQEEERERESWAQAFGAMGMNDPQLQELARTNPRAAQMVWDAQQEAAEKQEAERRRQEALASDAEFFKTNGGLIPNALPVDRDLSSLPGSVPEPSLTSPSRAATGGFAGESAAPGIYGTGEFEKVNLALDPPPGSDIAQVSTPQATGAAAPSGNSEVDNLLKQRDLFTRSYAVADNEARRSFLDAQIKNIDRRIDLASKQDPNYRTVTDPTERRALGIPEDDTRVYQVSENGQLSAIGGSGQAPAPGVEARQRAELAQQYGIDPNSAEGQRFILTGTLPASDRGVTAGDRQAIREADELVMSGESSLSLLDKAIQLSNTAYDGLGASTRARAAAVFGAQDALDTIELDNIVTEQALQSMKSIFGGNPTEGERAILLEIQGSANQPKPVRDAILTRARQMVERRIAFNRDRANELRGGTYYNTRPPSGEQPGQTGSGLQWKVVE